MSLVKVPILLAGALGNYIALMPPQPKASTNERPKNVSVNERIFSSLVRLYARSFRLIVTSASLLEIAVIVASKYSAHPLSARILRLLVPGPKLLVDRVRVSQLCIFGCSLAAVGGFIRYQCYRALDRMFTYEVSIRDDHQLVTTGPYSYVRHPGYTSAIAAMVGPGLWLFAPRSWSRESGILNTTWGRIGACLYALHLVWGSVSVIARTNIEDVLLSKHFGEQWGRWAKRVPYRLVPYIY